MDAVDAARAAGWPISEDVARETRRGLGLLPAATDLDADIAAFNARADAQAKEAGRNPAGTPAALEEAMQMRVVKWADDHLDQYPELAWLYHCPNGGGRRKGQAGRLKGMGVRAGVLDLFLPVARGIHHGAYWELKAGKGKLRKEQKAFIEFATRQRYYVKVFYDDSAAVIADIISYLTRPAAR